MVNISETLDKWMSERQVVLIENYDRLKLRASGEFERGVYHTTEGTHSEMKAPYHAWMMVHGRKPNVKKDKESLKKWVGWAGSTFLAQWVEDKGIKVNPYAVAWKIARDGVIVPNKNNPGTLLTDTFTQTSFDELYKSLLFIYTAEIKSSIQKTWQQ